MSLVLAIEPDPKQAGILKRIVGKRVRAELVLTDSKDAAVAAMGQRVPDLVLVSALLSPRDEAELAKHLRNLEDAEHLQTLTIPLLAGRAPAEEDEASGLFKKFKRRKTQAAPEGCDPAMFAEQIVGYLERAELDRAERAQRLVREREQQALLNALGRVEESPGTTGGRIDSVLVAGTPALDSWAIAAGTADAVMDLEPESSEPTSLVEAGAAGDSLPTPEWSSANDTATPTEAVNSEPVAGAFALHAEAPPFEPAIVSDAGISEKPALMEAVADEPNGSLEQRIELRADEESTGDPTRDAIAAWERPATIAQDEPEALTIHVPPEAAREIFGAPKRPDPQSPVTLSHHSFDESDDASALARSEPVAPVEASSVEQSASEWTDVLENESLESDRPVLPATGGVVEASSDHDHIVLSVHAIDQTEAGDSAEQHEQAAAVAHNGDTELLAIAPERAGEAVSDPPEPVVSPHIDFVSEAEKVSSGDSDVGGRQVESMGPSPERASLILGAADAPAIKPLTSTAWADETSLADLAQPDGWDRLLDRLAEAKTPGAEQAALPELPLNRWAEAATEPREEDSIPDVASTSAPDERPGASAERIAADVVEPDPLPVAEQTGPVDLTGGTRPTADVDDGRSAPAGEPAIVAAATAEEATASPVVQPVPTGQPERPSQERKKRRRRRDSEERPAAVSGRPGRTALRPGAPAFDRQDPPSRFAREEPSAQPAQGLDGRWIASALDALRNDIQLLRKESAAATERQPARTPDSEAAELKRADVAAKAARKKTQSRKLQPAPLQDEWGLYDPSQCGFEALFATIEANGEDEQEQDETPADLLLQQSTTKAIGRSPSDDLLQTGTVSALGSQRLAPLAMWAHAETPPARAPRTPAIEIDHLRSLIENLAIPPAVAAVGYAGGCTIGRVRITRRKRTKRTGSANEPVIILSRKLLRELSSSAPEPPRGARAPGRAVRS